MTRNASSPCRSTGHSPTSSPQLAPGAPRVTPDAAGAGLPRGGRVLELGCGRGIALPALDRHLAPARLVGLDVDRALLDQARRRLSSTRTRAELVRGDVRRLPFPDGDFDLIIDFGTCFHIARADEALREVSRVLVAGGIFATETRLNQLFSYPRRSHGRFLPWSAASGLVHQRHAGLWQSGFAAPDRATVSLLPAARPFSFIPCRYYRFPSPHGSGAGRRRAIPARPHRRGAVVTSRSCAPGAGRSCRRLHQGPADAARLAPARRWSADHRR